VHAASHSKIIMVAVFAFAAAVVGTVTAAPVASVAVDVEQIHIAQGGPAGEWPTPCGFTDMLLSRDTMVDAMHSASNDTMHA
jgi:hypothetical protein